MKTLKVHNSERELPIGKILCLGRNYAEHAKEMGSGVPTTPVVFLKPPSSIVYSGQHIVRPPFSKEMHHEVELVVAISRGGMNIPVSEAGSYVLGYAIGLDMTLRDVQAAAKKSGLPWFTAKGFQTSAAISDVIPIERFSSSDHLTIRCTVNGVVRQQTSTERMIFSIPETIAYLSTVVELEPGDLIYTGTPEGVSAVNDGDVIEAELEGFIRTRHTVKVLGS